MDITPYILAGGNSSRMGTDKRLIRFKGIALLDIACILAKKSTGIRPILTGNNLPACFCSSFQCIPDLIPGKGPLGGITAALCNCQSQWALFLPVDMPNLTAPVIEHMMLNCSPESDAIIIKTAENTLSLPVIIRVSTFPVWKKQLAEFDLSLKAVYKRLRLSIVDYSDKDSSVFLNVNTISDIS